MTEPAAPLTSTLFDLSGVATSDDVRLVTDHVSAVPGVGGVAIELLSGSAATMFIKHKAEVELDRTAIAAAVEQAGDYGVVAVRPAESG